MKRSDAAEPWDVVVVGTGFGGSMAALPLVRAGRRVLLLERGRWVDRDESAWDPHAILVGRKYKSATPYEVGRWGGGARSLVYPDEAVGGNSVFYGAASFRLREDDFALGSRLGGSRKRATPFVNWPIRYEDLAPFYDEAERLLGVAGIAGEDPTEPARRCGYASAPPPYGSSARRLADAARSLGLHPFPIPLAISFGTREGRASCVQCLTCDLFPCKIGAKNDLSVTVLPEAMGHGAVVRPRTVAARLLVEGGRVRGVECLDADTGERFTVSCRACIVSCGAIGSAALLLRSGLGDVEPHGRLIGRHLMRHCSGIVIGLFRDDTNPEQRFNKQVAITDLYFGPPGRRGESGLGEPCGMLQALQVPPPEYFLSEAPFPLGALGARTSRHHIYVLCIAHDAPNPASRVELDAKRRDRYGLPVTRLFHRYARRDLRARRALYRQAAQVLRAAGALVRLRKPINTFSHAVGTCRFGTDPSTAVLDPWCNFFGVPNLFVIDGSFMPTAGAVNPSLTISANALRAGAHLALEWDAITGGGRG